MAIVIGAEIRTDAGDLNRDLKRDARMVESTLGKSFKNVGKVATGVFRSVGSAVRSIASTKGLIVGALAGAGVDKLIRSSSELDVKVKALANQTGKSVPQINRYIGTINDAALGLLDFSVASEAANRALLAGIPRQRVAELARYSAAVATARGESDRFAQSFPQLIKTIAGGETGLLKDFGVFIDPADLKGIGFMERNAKILELTIEQLERKSKKLGITGNEVFFTYTGIFGNIKDITLEIGRATTQSAGFKQIAEQIKKITGGIADSLRDNGYIETLKTSFKLLLELAGALAGDLGEAISRGIGRGIRFGLELIGVDLEKTLGKETADKVNAFLNESTDFSRTTSVIGNIGKAFEQPDRVPETDPRANRREFKKNLRRLREIDNALKHLSGTVFRRAVDVERREAKVNDEQVSPRQLRFRAEARLEEKRQELFTKTRGGQTLDGTQLRRLEHEIRQRQERFDNLPDSVPQTVRKRQQDKLDELEKRRKELVGFSGVGDARTPDEKVNERLGINVGDSLGQVIAKSFLSGVIEDSQLKATVISWFNEGIGAGTTKLITSLGSLSGMFVKSIGKVLIAAIVELADKLLNLDWVGIGKLIALGLVPQDVKDIAGVGAAVGKTVVGAGSDKDKETTLLFLDELERTFGGTKLVPVAPKVGNIPEVTEKDFQNLQRLLSPPATPASTDPAQADEALKEADEQMSKMTDAVSGYKATFKGTLALFDDLFNGLASDAEQFVNQA